MPEEDQLQLNNRHHVLTAYNALTITGAYPEGEEILREALTVQDRLTIETMGQDRLGFRLFFLQGEKATMMKSAIIASLQMVIEHTPPQHDGRRAAEGLLDLLQD